MPTKTSKIEKPTNLRPKEEALYEYILKLLIKAGEKFRAYGSGHSKLYHSAIFDSSNMIDMRNFVENPILEHLGSEGKSYPVLTVSAGMALGDVRNFLEPHGLKLYGTPESKYISIGGAILFSAHNSSGYWSTISDYVVDMLIIDGLGKIRLITDPELFVNYGLLGIVIKVRIKVFPATNLKFTYTLVKNINDIKITNATYSLVFGPYSGRILKAEVHLTDQKAYKSWKRVIWDLAFWPLQFKLVSKLESFLASWIPSIGILASELFTYEPDVIRDKFDYFESIPRSHAFTLEYALKRSDLEKVHQRIMQLINDYRKRGVFVLRFWCRFQNASPYINDLAFGHETILAEITLSDKQKHAPLMVYDISKILLELGGKPHLGKTILKPECLKNYDFTLLKKAIKRYDPNFVFQNKFTNAVFEKDEF